MAAAAAVKGSERALAATLLALARRQNGADPEELAVALAQLRQADAKGRFAYALNEVGRLHAEMIERRENGVG